MADERTTEDRLRRQILDSLAGATIAKVTYDNGILRSVRLELADRRIIRFDSMYLHVTEIIIDE